MGHVCAVTARALPVISPVAQSVCDASALSDSLALVHVARFFRLVLQTHDVSRRMMELGGVCVYTLCLTFESATQCSFATN